MNSLYSTLSSLFLAQPVGSCALCASDVVSGEDVPVRIACIVQHSERAQAR